MKSLVLSMLCGTSAFCTQRIELESTLRAICTLQFSKRCSSVLCNFRNGALLYFAIFDQCYFVLCKIRTSAISIKFQCNSFNFRSISIQFVQFQLNFNAISVKFQCNSRKRVQFQSNFNAILKQGVHFQLNFNAILTHSPPHTIDAPPTPLTHPPTPLTHPPTPLPHPPTPLTHSPTVDFQCNFRAISMQFQFSFNIILIKF